MIKQGHIGTACAFRDLGFSPEQVKLAFVNQGLLEEEADYLVKEAWGSVAGGIMTKAIPWLGKTFGMIAPKAGGLARGGTLTKGLLQGGKVSQGVGSALYGVGAAARHGLGAMARNPVKGLLGGGVNVLKGAFGMAPKTSIPGMASNVHTYWQLGKGILGPGQAPMPTPQMGM